MSRLTIRSRVALWYGLVIVAVLAVVALAVSLVHERIGLARIDTELQNAMRTIDGVVTPNDHSDEAYDGRVLDRFAEFDLRADPICADLSGALARFSLYRVRLADALTRARSGALDYVADNLESYHTVWFQLHEDLLATLGLPRH